MGPHLDKTMALLLERLGEFDTARASNDRSFSRPSRVDASRPATRLATRPVRHLFHGARGSPYELCVEFHWYCGSRVYAHRPVFIVNFETVLAMPNAVRKKWHRGRHAAQF